MLKINLLAIGLFIYVIGFSQRPNKNMQLRSVLNLGTGLSNISGYVDTLGNEYALVGTYDGMTIVNVTNPDLPVRLLDIPGPNSIWREIKTHQKYAYVTTEGGEGLQIVNLSSLPNISGVAYKHWKPAIGQDSLWSIHALHIDNGFAYLYGTNIATVIADLSNPWFPIIAGIYDQGDPFLNKDAYVHDGIVKNDTMYACHIYTGVFRVVDCRDKQNLIVLAEQQTPKKFTHNTWLSENGKIIFTTDEVSNSEIAAYDISDLDNITYLDAIKSQNSGAGAVVHNVHVKGKYAYTSYYRDGMTVTDVSRPTNLVNVGWYDSSPFQGDGFNGAWGVYPFLPSGNMLISDMEEGLVVVTPTLRNACYFEGNVMDSICCQPKANVKVTLYGPDTLFTYTDINGNYKMGTVEAGNYSVRLEASSVLISPPNIILSAGVLTLGNYNFVPPAPIQVNILVKNSLGNPIAGALIKLSNSSYNYERTADGNGNVSICGFPSGKFALKIGFWEKITFCDSVIVNSNNNSFTFSLENGIYDDFSFDFGWTVIGNCSSGMFARGKPVINTSSVTTVRPEFDSNVDCDDNAYVTGISQNNSDPINLDDGYTRLTSPYFDLTNIASPYISLKRWYNILTGTKNDTFFIRLKTPRQRFTLGAIKSPGTGLGTWVKELYRVKDFCVPQDSMQIEITASDYAPANIVRAAIDNFYVVDSLVLKNELKTLTKYRLYPNPSGEFLWIEGINDQTKVEIFNINGQRILETIYSSKMPLNIQELPKGMHILNILGEDKKINHHIKFVKQ